MSVSSPGVIEAPPPAWLLSERKLLEGGASEWYDYSQPPSTPTPPPRVVHHFSDAAFIPIPVGVSEAGQSRDAV